MRGKYVKKVLFNVKKEFAFIDVRNGNCWHSEDFINLERCYECPFWVGFSFKNGIRIICTYPLFPNQTSTRHIKGKYSKTRSLLTFNDLINLRRELCEII